MDRRGFIEIMGALGALPQVALAQARQGRARCYALDTCTLTGTQSSRLAEYLSKSYLPALVLNDISAPTRRRPPC